MKQFIFYFFLIGLILLPIVEFIKYISKKTVVVEYNYQNGNVKTEYVYDLTPFPIFLKKGESFDSTLYKRKIYYDNGDLKFDEEVEKVLISNRYIVGNVTHPCGYRDTVLRNGKSYEYFMKKDGGGIKSKKEIKWEKQDKLWFLKGKISSCLLDILQYCEAVLESKDYDKKGKIINKSTGFYYISGYFSHELYELDLLETIDSLQIKYKFLHDFK